MDMKQSIDRLKQIEEKFKRASAEYLSGGSCGYQPLLKNCFLSSAFSTFAQDSQSTRRTA